MHLPTLLALSLIISAATAHLDAAAAPDVNFPLDAYTVVEACVATHANDKGTNEMIMRYVLKGAAAQQIGGRWFIVGKTPNADHVLLNGSNWQTLMIPLDEVRAMAGAAAVADFVTSSNPAMTEPIGVPATDVAGAGKSAP